MSGIPEVLDRIGSSRERGAGPIAGVLEDPNTGEPVGDSPSSSAEQVDRAIAAADQAHRDAIWSSLSVEERATALDRFATELERDTDELARLDSLNSGVPISVMTQFAGSLLGTIRGAAELARGHAGERRLDAADRLVTLRRVPWGPSALITPWNAPAALAVKKLAFALAAGATTILKPSPEAPWSATVIVNAALRAGIPEGVINLVHGGGDVGAQLVADPRVKAIAMTGSTPTGRSIARAAAPNFTRLRLELGSNNPAIVVEDADVAATARLLAQGMMKLSGQWCEAPRRVIVKREIHDALVDALVSALADIRIGSSLDESSEAGPVAFRLRQRTLHEQRDRMVAAGATSIPAQEVPTQGFFVAPTVVVGDDLDPSSELFGPIITVEQVASDAEALLAANRGEYGLAGYVFSEDEQRARALGLGIVAGEVKVNGTSLLDMAPQSAQGFFASAGIGGHGDVDLLHFFSGAQVIGTDDPGWPI